MARKSSVAKKEHRYKLMWKAPPRAQAWAWAGP